MPPPRTAGPRRRIGPPIGDRQLSLRRGSTPSGCAAGALSRNRAVQRLARDLDAKKRWVVEIEVKPGNSNGGGANAAGQTMESEGHLYSPPIADNFRLFGLGSYSAAHPPEGFVERERIGAGLEWRTPDFVATANPTCLGHSAQGRGAGAGLAGDGSNQGRRRRRASIRPDAVTRAYGVGNSYSAKRYRWNGASHATAAIYSATATATEWRSDPSSCWSTTGFDPPAGPSLASSTAGAPITIGATFGLPAEHTLWRRYDISLARPWYRCALWQWFCNDWIGTVNYEHRWRFDPRPNCTMASC